MIDYQVRMTELAPGNAGIVATARRMRGMILDHDPLTRQVAEDVLLELPGQPDTYRQAEALYQWVQDHLQYVHDHVHVEEVRNSNFLVNKILSAPGQRAAGDCDDYVVLLGSLLTAVGIPVAIVLTSARPDGEYDHVFLRVQTSQGLVTADAIPIGETAPEYMPFGWEVPAGAVTNRLELPVGSSQASGGGHPVGRLGQDSTLVTTDPTMAQPFADPSTGVAIDAALQDPFVPGSSAMDTVTDPAGIISTTYATGAVLETHPDATVELSYQMPTYKVGSCRLYVGAWKHGISIYGWQKGHDGGFTDRHPELKTSTGTVRLRPEDAAAIPDEELLDLVRSALDPRPGAEPAR